MPSLTQLVNQGITGTRPFSTITGVPPYIQSNNAIVTGSDQITNMVSLTQAEYDALPTKDAATMYVIIG